MTAQGGRPGNGWGSVVDLAAVVALVALTILVRTSQAALTAAVPAVDWALAQALLGIAFVLFVPGYALVSALFPEAGRSGDWDTADRTGLGARLLASLGRGGARGIDGVERVALAFALSIVAAPLVAIGLSVVPAGVDLPSTVQALSVVAVAGVAVAAVRRWRLPAERRFGVPLGAWGGTGSGSPAGTLLNVALALSMVVAVGLLSFAVVAPPDGERFTDFYVLNEGGENELVAGSYPDVLLAGQPERLYVGVENHEARTVTYSVVVQLQRVETRDGDRVVTDRVELDRFSTTLAADETTIRPRDLTVSDDMAGEDLRLAFLLYVDGVPADPSQGNAYRSLHLWVDVR